MSEPASTRRPYQTPMPRTWWLKHRYYVFYMLREATVLPLLFFCGCLLAGFYSLHQGEQSWLNWLAFMAKPWVIALNIFTFAASLFHAKTFFELFPRVMPLLPAPVMIAGQWLGTVAVCVGLLLLLGSSS